MHAAFSTYWHVETLLANEGTDDECDVGLLRLSSGCPISDEADEDRPQGTASNDGGTACE